MAVLERDGGSGVAIMRMFLKFWLTVRTVFPHPTSLLLWGDSVFKELSCAGLSVLCRVFARRNVTICLTLGTVGLGDTRVGGSAPTALRAAPRDIFGSMERRTAGLAC